MKREYQTPPPPSHPDPQILESELCKPFDYEEFLFDSEDSPSALWEALPVLLAIWSSALPLSVSVAIYRQETVKPEPEITIPP